MGVRRRTGLIAAGLLALGAAGVAGRHSADAAETDDPVDLNLHQAADRIGLHTGSMANWGTLHQPAQAERAVYIGNTISPVDLSWGEARPARDDFDFDHSDWIHGWAQQNDVGVHQSGALAARNFYNPDWLNDGSWSADDLDALLCEHIETVLPRYGDNASMWRVTHEAIKPDGNWLERSANLWVGLGTTGDVPDYIPRAFELAAQARGDRDIKLYHDEALNAAIGEGSTEATYQLVKELKRRNVPIDGVGFQMHLYTDGTVVQNHWQEAFDYDGFTTNLRRYADLGVEVYLTEFDVRVDGNRDADRQAQARVYGEVARRCVAESNCKALLFWGLDDKHGWERQYYPTMFDPDGTAKPAYFKLLDAVLAAGAPSGVSSLRRTPVVLR